MTNNTIPNVPRELLERAAYTLELAYEVDTPTVRDIRDLLSAPSPAGVDGLVAVKVWEADADWDDHELVVRLSDAQAIIDGLQGDAAALKEQSETRWAAYVRESNIRREIEQQRDQLACLLRDARKYLAPGAVRSRIDAALSGIKEPQ